MKLKDMTLVLLTLILLVLLVLLGNRMYKYYEASKYVDDTNDKNAIKIGFSLGTLKEERWVKDRDIFMAKAKELGAEVFVQNANNDDEDQLKQVKYLLDKKIDVLVIVPNDLKKASAAVEMAKKAGVKVISYDRLVLNSN
ncbi:MAG: substrate-binding domain-containing protein, partial [Thermoanaerobacterium sp.]|nr:substrate-binding domain-containing protein [Thermoanaerobacterium sp.]